MIPDVNKNFISVLTSSNRNVNESKTISVVLFSLFPVIDPPYFE